MPNHRSSVKCVLVAAVALATGEMTLQLLAVPAARASGKLAAVRIAPPSPTLPLPEIGDVATVEDIGPGMAEPLYAAPPVRSPAAARGPRARGVR